VEKTLASNRTRNGPTDGLSALHARVPGAAINKKSGLLQRLLRAEWRARTGRKETDRENIAVVRDSGPANKRKRTLCIYHRRVNRARKNNRSTLLQLPAARTRARKSGGRRSVRRLFCRDCERAISSYFNGRMCFSHLRIRLCRPFGVEGGGRIRDRFSSEKRELATMTMEFLRDDGGEMIGVLAEMQRSFSVLSSGL